MTPDFVFSTIPSGSMRVTVASLYSLPLTVLKSSAKAADAQHRIKNVATFVLICYVNRRSRFSSDILAFSGQGESVWERTPRLSRLSLSEAQHLWSNWANEERFEMIRDSSPAAAGSH